MMKTIQVVMALICAPWLPGLTAATRQISPTRDRGIWAEVVTPEYPTGVLSISGNGHVAVLAVDSFTRRAALHFRGADGTFRPVVSDGDLRLGFSAKLAIPASGDYMYGPIVMGASSISFGAWHRPLGASQDVQAAWSWNFTTSAFAKVAEPGQAAVDVIGLDGKTSQGQITAIGFPDTDPQTGRIVLETNVFYPSSGQVGYGVFSPEPGFPRTKMRLLFQPRLARVVSFRPPAFDRFGLLFTEYDVSRWNSATGQVQDLGLNGRAIEGELLNGCVTKATADLNGWAWCTTGSPTGGLVSRLVSLGQKPGESQVVFKAGVAVAGITTTFAQYVASDGLSLFGLGTRQPNGGDPPDLDGVATWPRIGEPVTAILARGDTVSGRKIGGAKPGLLATHTCFGEVGLVDGSWVRLYKPNLTTPSPATVESGKELMLAGCGIGFADSNIQHEVVLDGRPLAGTPVDSSTVRATVPSDWPAGSAQVRLRLTNGSSIVELGPVTITVTEVVAAAPRPTVTALTEPWGMFAPLAEVSPNGILTVWGSNFASTDCRAELDGSLPVPMLFSGNGQANVRVPADAPLGNHTLRLVCGDRVGTDYLIRVVTAAPSLLTTADGALRVFRADWAEVSPVATTAAGDPIVLFAIGFGNGPDFGVQAQINGLDAEVIWAGEVSGSPGLYQVNIVTPVALPATEPTQLTITVSGSARTYRLP
ncbi:MAG: hypothetical protein HY978_02995 [Candidatus Liptonbacteria bacterium]|nr:hypothetical protein [Candidatus Liptonbacteria bacterium]